MSRAEEAIATLKTAVPNTNSTAEGLSVDISSDESIQNAFNTVAGKFNHIDVLVNNAGTSLPRSLPLTHKTDHNQAPPSSI